MLRSLSTFSEQGVRSISNREQCVESSAKKREKREEGKGDKITLELGRFFSFLCSSFICEAKAGAQLDIDPAVTRLSTIPMLSCCYCHSITRFSAEDL